MLGSFLGLETAKRGLQAAQAAIETASHNVANANTQGYSRQRVNLSATPALPVPGLLSALAGQVGTGVMAASITRQRDAFLDQEYWQQNQYLGNWTAQQSAIQRVSAILNEPSDNGLASVLQSFWVAWDKLSADPTDLSARMLVVQSAQTLAQTLNETARQLNDLQADLKTGLGANVTQVNTLLSQIADLNGEIAKLEASGQTPNDLLDQRDLLVDRLSNLVAVTISPQTDGTYTLVMNDQRTGDAYTLVQGDQVLLQLQDDLSSDPPILQLVDFDGNVQAAPDAIGGQLQGTLTAIQTVAGYQADLNAFAEGLANGPMTVTLAGDWTDSSGTLHSAGSPMTVNGLNGLLAMGYDLHGNHGAPLFVGDTSGITAANIAVNQAIATDVTQLAAGLSSKSGDGTLAATISGARNAQVQFGGGSSAQMPLTQGTYDEFLQAMVGALGVLGQQINQEVTNQQALVQQVDQQRQSVSGVSIDEEMSDLIRYQQAYDASAKVIATLNDLFQNLLQNV